MQTEGGHQHADGDVSNTATHHSPCHPTIHDGPTHHHREGGANRGYPTTRTVHRDTRRLHHTPGNGTVGDMTAVLASTALGVDGIGHTH